MKRENLHQLFVELTVAAKEGNKEWLASVLNDVLKRKIKDYPVWINKNIPRSLRKEYAQFIAQTFDLVNNSKIDEQIKLMFFKKLTHITKGDNRLRLTQLLNQGFSNSLEFDISSYTYGVKKAPFWIDELDNFKVKEDLLKKYFSAPSRNSLDAYSYHIFEYGMPRSMNSREKIVNSIIKNYKKYNYDRMSSLIIGLRNKVLKKELAKKDEFFSRPLFTIERQFLYDTFRKTGSSWPAYNLLYLGQQEEEFIKSILVDL